MNKRRVVITGIGVVTPVGNTIEKFWKSLLEGHSGVKRIACFDPSNFSSQIAAEVLDFDPAPYLGPKEIRKTDRFVQFAVVAAKMAIDDSKLDLNNENLNRIGVIVGSGIGGLHTIESEHAKYLERGHEKGPKDIPVLNSNADREYGIRLCIYVFQGKRTKYCGCNRMRNRKSRYW